MPYLPKTFNPNAKQKQQQRRLYENSPQRRADKAFYCSARWRKFRACYLHQHPLCVECKAKGFTVPAVHVDHLIDRKHAPDRALDETNVQALCHACHSGKTARTTIARPSR